MAGGAWTGLKKALDQAAALGVEVGKAAAQGAKLAAGKVQQELLGAKCLADYEVGEQVACGGPCGLWRLYACRSRKPGSPNPVVSAWILDKRELQAEGGGAGQYSGAGMARPSARQMELFLEQARKDVHHLARLKHPSVLRLVAPLEETRTQLVFLTEPVFSSLGDLLHASNRHGLPPALAAERGELRLSQLEIKHGLLQVAEGLHWLGSEAGLVHRGVCPDSIVITATGQWKLAGFGWAVTAFDISGGRGAGAGGDSASRPLDYSSSSPSLLALATQPPLPYTAPELVAPGSTPSTSPAADVFSLGALTLELLTRRQLLPVGNRLVDYESRVHSLALVDMAGVPFDLEQTLRAMVAPVPGARPPAAAFTACQWLQNDVQLRALRFLDGMLQRDALQKAAFLRDLPGLCAQFDSRVLRYCVLPPLLGELRSTDLLPALLPVVLKIVALQPPSDFVDTTLPALTPLLASATGEALLLLVQNAELLGRAGGQRGPGGTPSPSARLLPALLVRAAEQGDVRCQEEMLRQCARLADSLDYEGLKHDVLPAVHKVCLSTTSANVRVGAFAALSRLAGRLDQAEADRMVDLMAQVTAVDKSAPTCMCVLALGESLAKQWGPRMAAERVLPVLAPLLVAPTLNGQQFGVAMRAAREILGAVEQARGGGGSGTHKPGSTASSRGSTPKAGAGGAVAAEPVDWMAAASLAGGAGTYGAPSSSSPGGNGVLAGLVPTQQQQQQQQPTPLAAAAPRAGGGSGFGVSSSIGSGKPLSAALLGGQPTQQSASPAATAAAAAADPFAWPPRTAAPAAAPSVHPAAGTGAGWQGSGLGTVTGSTASGAGADPFARMPPLGTSGAGLGGSSGGASDPFAGLELRRPAGAPGPGSVGPGAAVPTTGAGGGLDPFDTLVMQHAAPAGQQAAQQQPTPGGFAGSLI